MATESQETDAKAVPAASAKHTSMERPVLKPGQRVGVYGGSFDPIHTGHIEPVLAALLSANLARVLYLPTAFPPHKRGVRQAPVHVRLAMVKLALEEHHALDVLHDEVVSHSAYTVDTLTKLSAEYPDCQFVLLIGADSYQNLTRWHRWQDIVAGWDMVVLPRPGWPVKAIGAATDQPVSGGLLPTEPDDRRAERDTVKAVLVEHSNRTHMVLEEPLVAVSSTQIRQYIQDNESLPSRWVPAPVLRFIQERGIYRTADRDATRSDDSTILPERATISTAAENQDARIGQDRNEILSLPPEVALAARTAIDRQATDLRLLQTGAVCDFADYFLVCSGNSDRQVGAIADAIRRALRKAGEKPLHVEGERRGTWVLMDYGHLIVHIFDPPTRDFYRLERLWGDAPRVPHQLFGLAKKDALQTNQ